MRFVEVAQYLLIELTYDDNLYALDVSTSQKRWRHLFGNAITSSPTVANGLIYVGSADDSLYAFHLQRSPLVGWSAVARPRCFNLPLIHHCWSGCSTDWPPCSHVRDFLDSLTSGEEPLSDQRD